MIKAVLDCDILQKWGNIIRNEEKLQRLAPFPPVVGFCCSWVLSHEGFFVGFCRSGVLFCRIPRTSADCPGPGSAPESLRSYRIQDYVCVFFCTSAELPIDNGLLFVGLFGDNTATHQTRPAPTQEASIARFCPITPA